jgi:hypothetical protein
LADHWSYQPVPGAFRMLAAGLRIIVLGTRWHRGGGRDGKQHPDLAGVRRGGAYSHRHPATDLRFDHDTQPSVLQVAPIDRVGLPLHSHMVPTENRVRAGPAVGIDAWGERE